MGPPRSSAVGQGRRVMTVLVCSVRVVPTPFSPATSAVSPCCLDNLFQSSSAFGPTTRCACKTLFPANELFYCPHCPYAACPPHGLPSLYGFTWVTWVTCVTIPLWFYMGYMVYHSSMVLRGLHGLHALPSLYGFTWVTWVTIPLWFYMGYMRYHASIGFRASSSRSGR